MTEEKTKLPGLEDKTDEKIKEITTNYIDNIGKETANVLGELVKEMVNAGTRTLKQKMQTAKKKRK